MSKFCPKCGCREEDSARFCHICGQSLIEENTKSEGDFEYDFGADEAKDDSPFAFDESVQSNPAPFVYEGPLEEARPYIATKIPNGKANQLRKNLFSWAIFLIVICALRFIFIFVGLDSANSISDSLKYFSGDLLNALQSYVNVYYSEFAILFVFLACAIALIVLATKVNKHVFPVQDDAVFKESKQTFIAAVVTLVVVAIYFILEMAAVILSAKISVMLDEDVLTVSQSTGAVIADVLLLTGAIICTVCSASLSRCRQN